MIPTDANIHRRLLERSPGVLWAYDARQETFTEISPNAEQLLGYPTAAWKTPGFWRRRLHPDDLERTVSACSEAAARGEEHVLEYRMLSADGRPVHVVDKAHNDGPLLRGVMFDVTHLRVDGTQHSTAQELETLLESFDGFLLVLDHQRRIRKAFGRGLVHSKVPGGAFIGQTLLELLGPAGLTDHEMVGRALEGETVSHERGSILHPDGQLQRWYSIRMRPLMTAFGACLGAVVAVRDVTERRNLEMGLILKDRLASLGTLAASVAHELRNPAGYVVTNATYLERELQRVVAGEKPSADLLEAVRDLREGALRIGEIASGLTRFVHAGEGRIELCELGASAASALRLAQGHLRKNASCEIDCPEPLWIRAEPTRLEQVFVNLVVNAAQAVGDGLKLKITARREDGHAVVTVDDNGPGIPPDVLPRLFHQFVTTKPRSIGTGLGLSIVRSIVEGLHGTIAAENLSSGGARFRIVLPLSPVGNA